ncbi:uncharacterized protein ACRADG_001812 [Cochliomyia hominivorax]
MWQQKNKKQLTHITLNLLATIVLFKINKVNCVLFPRGGSYGYLAAVAMPLELPNRNVYMAFNFESNYGLPSNDSYNEWIDRWDIDEQFVGIGNDVNPINNRKKRSLPPPYDRRSFYRTFTGYLDHFEMNGTGCLLRTICEVAASSLHENNGVLGSLFKILFMPTTSRPETSPLHHLIADNELYKAEWQGRQYMAKNNNNNYNKAGGGYADEFDVTANACMDYMDWCPEGVINMISSWY